MDEITLQIVRYCFVDEGCHRDKHMGTYVYIFTNRKLKYFLLTLNLLKNSFQARYRSPFIDYTA